MLSMFLLGRNQKGKYSTTTVEILSVFWRSLRALHHRGFCPSARSSFIHHFTTFGEFSKTQIKMWLSHLVNVMLNIVFIQLVSWLMLATLLDTWAQSAKLTQQNHSRPRFFSFNSSASLFWARLILWRWNLTKFGIVCDNIITPHGAWCMQVNRLDCNPEPVNAPHSSSLGLHLACEERKTAPPYIWYNLWVLLRPCPGLWA